MVREQRARQCPAARPADAGDESVPTTSVAATRRSASVGARPDRSDAAHVRWFAAQARRSEDREAEQQHGRVAAREDEQPSPAHARRCGSPGSLSGRRRRSEESDRCARASTARGRGASEAGELPIVDPRRRDGEDPAVRARDERRPSGSGARFERRARAGRRADRRRLCCRCREVRDTDWRRPTPALNVAAADDVQERQLGRGVRRRLVSSRRSVLQCVGSPPASRGSKPARERPTATRGHERAPPLQVD